LPQDQDVHITNAEPVALDEAPSLQLIRDNLPRKKSLRRRLEKRRRRRGRSEMIKQCRDDERKEVGQS
jgi:hypothetical protein